MNLRSTWSSLEAEIAHMLEHGGGAVVNVASVAGMLPTCDASLSYSVAKAGIIHLTRLAAVAYAGDGVQAEAILWLCSDAAAMTTGHVLPVDGGWTAR